VQGAARSTATSYFNVGSAGSRGGRVGCYSMSHLTVMASITQVVLGLGLDTYDKCVLMRHFHKREMRRSAMRHAWRVGVYLP
jgi:hypothetical protein